MAGEEANPNPLEQLLELLVYAPIGLLYEYPEVVPKLIKRGKSQVKLARVLGQMAANQARAGAGGSGSSSSSSSSSAGGTGMRPEDVVGAAWTILARAITEVGANIGLAPPKADRAGTGSPASAPPAPARPAPASPDSGSAPNAPADAAADRLVPPATPPTPSGADAAAEATADPAPPASGRPAARPASGARARKAAPGRPGGVRAARSGARSPQPAPAEPATAEAAAPAPAPAAVPEADGPLPIAGYGQLAAREIVGLLGELSAAQRERVRRHEAATRRRKTVLAKLDQLDQSDPPEG